MPVQEGISIAVCSEWLAPYILSIRGAHEHSLEYVFRTAIELGYDGVELAPHTLAHLESTAENEYRRSHGKYLNISDLVSNGVPQEIRALADEVGIAIPALHWILSDPPIEKEEDGETVKIEPPIFQAGLSALPHITSGVQVQRIMASAYLRKDIDFAIIVGADGLVLGSPKQRTYGTERRLLTAQERAYAFHNAKDTLVESKVLAHAVERNVTIALEPLAPFMGDDQGATNVFISDREVKRFITYCGDPAGLSMMLDTNAMQGQIMYKGGSVKHPTPCIVGIINNMPLELLSHYHANVGMRAPGEDTDLIVGFAPIFHALLNKGYLGKRNGWVSVVPFQLSGKGATRVGDAHMAIGYLRECYSSVS